MLPKVLLIAVAAALSSLALQTSHTSESLRGVNTVSRQVAWASGTHGTFLRTADGGLTWTPAQVPDATGLDFRAVVAFSTDEAYLMSSGSGDQSRIYHTADAGRHWQLQFTNPNPKGFFDSMAFWDHTHGVVLGDPVPDESGKLKFEVLLTEDGQTWQGVRPSQLPDAVAGEGAFAASNTCLATISPAARGRSGGDPNLWFATGGPVARVFHSPDRGHTWELFSTPIIHGGDSAGIFSIAFRDQLHGVVAGGDYKRPTDDGPNLAFTADGGKTWSLSSIHPQAFFSAATYDRATHRLRVVAQDFILTFDSDSNPKRLTVNGNPDAKFNAASAFPDGGMLIVGPKGTIAAVH